MENPVYVSMFRNLGSSGVPIPSPEVYTSLQTGVVDGYEHPVGAYMGISVRGRQARGAHGARLHGRPDTDEPGRLPASGAG